MRISIISLFLVLGLSFQSINHMEARENKSLWNISNHESTTLVDIELDKSSVLLLNPIVTKNNLLANPPQIDVWYGATQKYGNNGIPQNWCNILGNIKATNGGSIILSQYALNGNTPVSLSLGADSRRLLNSGDFNIDLDFEDLVSGDNEVVITAEDNDNSISRDTVIINYTPGNVWPNPYTVDWTALTDESKLNDVSHVVDGKWELTANGIRTSEPGYDRLIGIGNIDWTNYEVLVPITIHTMPGGAGVGVLLRWEGHTDTPVTCAQPKCGYLPLGDIAWYRPNKLEFFEGGNTSRTLTLNTTYMFRTKVETDQSGSTKYYLKVWEQGTSEPGLWDLEKTVGTNDLQNGCFLLITHKADVTFGNVTVTPGPLNISNIQVGLSANKTEATITWNTNQLATTELSHGLSTLYEEGTIQDLTLKNTHSVSLTGLMVDTIYHYKIDAENAGAAETASSGDKIFVTSTAGILSDDFCDGSLNPNWTFYNPLNDASYGFSGASTSDAFLEITVPAGPEHQLYTAGIKAAHVLQAMNNADFEVEVKFESPVNAPQYQMQGIVVKEDASKFLRFEFFSKNNDTYLYCQGFDLPTISTAYANTSIGLAGISPLYMRVKRENNDWTLSYSFDGSSWTIGANFTYVIAPTEIGPYSGNGTGNSSPEHTAKIDYFMNLDDPIVVEDDCNVLQAPILGAIGDQYLSELESDTIIITASDVDANDSLLVFSATGLPTFATLLNNNDGTASLILHPLLNDAGVYPVTVNVVDTHTLSDFETFDIVVSLQTTGNAGIVSDDFCEGTLSPFWIFNNPLSDASSYGFTGTSTSDVWLEINVPGGPEHQVWTDGIQAPHIIQSANDVDFELEIKFESPVNAPQYQEQGLLIKEDNYNFLRFEMYGTNSATYMLSAVLSGTNTYPLNPNITYNQQILPLNSAPVFMRVKRDGDQWIQSYSVDSINWIVAGNFTHIMAVSQVGIYGGNASGANSPGHIAQFDYFQDLAAPLLYEDQCACVFTVGQCISDNTFLGTIDNDWGNPCNWSSSCVPGNGTITGIINIAADCTVSATDNNDYTFGSGAMLAIASGITLTNNGTGTWTIEDFGGLGSYVGDLEVNGKLQPGYIAPPPP